MTPMPDFRPHPLLPTGHLQTLAGILLPQSLAKELARQHRVLLDDGDQIVVLHDDIQWQVKPAIGTAPRSTVWPGHTPVLTCSGSPAS